MTVITKRRAEPPVWLGTIFDRIVCGVDGTESSRAAVVQANRLLAARRILELVSVVEETSAAWSGLSAPSDVDRQYEEAQCAIREGRDQCPHARSTLLFGDPGPKLVAAAREVDATLVVIGAPDSGRLGPFVLGGPGTYVLHNAPCSVLIARHADEDAFPRSIVVGHDGSPAAVEAAIVAKELALRFSAELRIVVATGGDPVHFDSLPPDEELEWSSARPIDALEAASDEADLLVVGNPGVRGPRTLGSVSERIGHLARCSVLVVRKPPRYSGLEADIADEVPDPEC